MKKIVIGTLITSMISNNVAYYDTIKNQSIDQTRNVEVIDTIDKELELESNEDLLESSIESEKHENGTNDKSDEDIKIDEDLNSSNVKNKEYKSYTIIDVKKFEELKNAILVPNSIINVTADIIFEENLEIKSNNTTINGNNCEFDLNDIYAFKVQAQNITLNNIEFKNYKTTGLNIYRAQDVTLSRLKLSGKDMSLPNADRSKVGIDIYKSTVKLDSIESNNNLYRDIQVRCESTVEILSKNVHNNATVHMQTIKATGENNSTIKDDKGLYVYGTEKNNNGNTTVDYFCRVDINIITAKDFIENISSSGNVLHIMNDIKFDKDDLSNLATDTNKLEIKSNILIEGQGFTIDLNKLMDITLNGNDIALKNVTIKNSKDIGINIYNSRDVVLLKVNVENSTRYGIFVNGSTAKLQDCSTINNNGGIIITRSRTLRGNNHIDSCVEIIGSIKQQESNINVAVTNLEMLNGYFQNNQFIVNNGLYNKYENDLVEKVLSEYYLDLFGIKGEERNKKYKEQTIDYMSVQTIIDAKNNTEVQNSDGTYVRLVGDGVTDDTENLKKLIEYAASHGREIYFPEGVYKITEDIDLATINLPALSNFTLSGDKNGLTIFDGSSNADKMLKLKNSEYKSYINYMNINNIVFNNIGLEFNGPYKKGITLNNNVFINGKYTREKNVVGEITKVTMEPYIIANNSKYVIEKNAFLRGKNYPGRGIATYRSKNTTIRDNFFGRLEGISDASQMLPVEVINKLNLIEIESQSVLSNTLKASGSQGNFFTAINNERYDENMTISNNYFDIDEGRNINSDFATNVLISGISVTKEGQRRDHIIYSKGYNNLNIYGNYFKGMENGAAGGIKIRNGKNAYIGSNHFKDVPLLTYIYSDLTKEECVLYNTTIYNNLFHQTTNFGGEGTGILYYQNFRDGDNLQFKDDSWENAYGDVQNFVIYKNEFISDDRGEITISNRASTAYGSNQFLSYGNEYAEYKNTLVNYNKGNLSLIESTEEEVLDKVNNGFTNYKNVDIPLTPIKVDITQLDLQINEANEFYNSILGYQYPEDVANELKELILETQELTSQNSLTQWETNKRVTRIQEALEKLKATINDKGFSPIINGLTDITIEIGEKFDPYAGVTFEDDRDSSDNLKVVIDMGNFDNSIPGSYIITYTIEDRDGNISIGKRKITVVKKNVIDNDKIEENENENDELNNNNTNGINENTTNNNTSNSNPNTGNESNLFNLALIEVTSLLGILFINRKRK